MRVLLVEDRRQDRELLATALRERGMEVIVAATDKAAYEVLRKTAEPVDLLVTDIDLGPGTTGFDVARRARASRPSLPVLYVTGLELDVGPHAVPQSGVIRKCADFRTLIDGIAAWITPFGEVRQGGAPA